VTPIDPERLTQLHCLFVQLLDVAPETRSSWLNERYPEDPTLCAEVLALLADDSRTAAWNLPVDLETGGSEDLSAATRNCTIEGLRVTGLLGSGGMGFVLAAQQEHPRRTLAVKVLHTTIGQLAEDRFQREIDILASLDHPNIAKVLFAGQTKGGQPFLAMELVHGLTLQGWSRQNPALDRVLSVLIRICRAVEHAHLRGVMHRDLKPSNILVAADDQPKLVDFGVARCLDMTSSDGELPATRDLVGTVSYMAPELFTATAGAIDFRVDIYAIGVIAYELLGGHRPFDLEDSSIAEIVRMLTSAERPPLRKFAPGIAPDLEAIVQMALAADRERRYASVASLREDLEHFLRHEPVMAMPATPGYRLKCILRRNRGLVAAVAGVILTLVVALGFSVRARMIAETAQIAAQESQAAAMRSRAEALAEAALAMDLAGRLQWVLELPAQMSLDPLLPFADVVRLAAARLEKDLDARPEVEARLRTGLARAFVHAGMEREARTQLARVTPIAATIAGDWPVFANYLMACLQTEIDVDGGIEGCRRHCDALMNGAHAAEGPDSRLAIEARGQLMLRLSAAGAHDEAERMAKQLLVDAGQARAAGVMQLGVWHASLVAAECALVRSDPQTAQGHFNRLVKPEIANLGKTRTDLRRRQDAIRSALVGRAATALERPGAVVNWVSKLEIGRVLLAIGDPLRAEPLLRSAFEHTRAAKPMVFRDVATAYVPFLEALQATGQKQEAVAVCEVVLDAAARGGVDPRRIQVNLIQSLLAANRLEEVVAASEQALPSLQSPTDQVMAFDVRRALGQALTGLALFESAEQVLLQAVEMAKQRGFAPKHVPELVDLYLAWGRPDEARRWQPPD